MDAVPFYKDSSCRDFGSWEKLKGCEVGQARNVLLCRAIARIGEVPQAEGFVRINVATLPNLQKSRFAADGQPLRLASSPLPLYRRRRGDTGEDIAMFQILSYGERLHQHWIICLYRRRRGDTGEDIRGGGLWLRGWVKYTLFSFGCENGIPLSNQIYPHFFD